MNSYHPKSLLNELQYYITPPHDCSYLKKKSARMVFLDPVHRIDVVTLSELSRMGFRRSGDFVYRPECHLCRQCLSSRVPVQDFAMNSSQKKAWKRNQDLSLKITRPEDASEIHYALYERYIIERHADGDMFPPSHDQFEKFLIHSCTDSFFLELWQGERLISVSTCDPLDDGLSAVYTFFDPDETRRCLAMAKIINFVVLIQYCTVKSPVFAMLCTVFFQFFLGLSNAIQGINNVFKNIQYLNQNHLLLRTLQC